MFLEGNILQNLVGSSIFIHILKQQIFILKKYRTHKANCIYRNLVKSFLFLTRNHHYKMLTSKHVIVAYILSFWTND